MSIIKTYILSLFMLFILASFSNCSSSKQINNEGSKTAMQDFQDKIPFTLEETSYKHWVAGVKGGGAGITMLISVSNNTKNIVIDAAYFRGMQTKLESINSGYVANFITKANQKEDIVMSTDKRAEYDNQLPNKADFPFQLKDNECVISYIEEGTTKYYKIENLVEKPRDEYPKARPKN
ncbi:hypothetical protein [Lacinutrix himadriensis]|uniref:hypothetical protein n=1 Tax=Lacinutrix himadriensis TaxID=641549 RepID=UPI000A5A5A22|nr:hypothetical protein [Lacinutrix himadriensis]